MTRPHPRRAAQPLGEPADSAPNVVHLRVVERGERGFLALPHAHPRASILVFPCKPGLEMIAEVVSGAVQLAPERVHERVGARAECVAQRRA
jgi:hypothetical protein